MAELDKAVNSAAAEGGTKPRNLLRKLIILIIAAAALIVALTLCLGIAAHYWLKNTDLKEFAEEYLSSATEGEATIGSAHIDLTKGINIKGFRLVIPNKGLIEIDELDVKYNRQSLMALKLDIDSIEVDRPVISLAGTDVTEESDAGSPEPGRKEVTFLPEIDIPFIPVSVNVRSIKINDISFSQTTPTSNIAIDHLNLKGKGSVGPLGIKMNVALLPGAEKPTLLFKNGDINLRALHNINLALLVNKISDIKVKGNIELDVQSITAPVEIKPGRMKLDLESRASLADVLTGEANLAVSLYDRPSVDMDAEWKAAKTTLDYTVKIKELGMPMEQMVALANIKGVNGVGSIKLDEPLTAKGSIDQSSFKHYINGSGAVDLQYFTAGDISGKQGATLKFNFTDFGLTNNSMAGNVDIDFTSPEIQMTNYFAKNVTLNTTAAPTGKSNGAITLLVDVDDAGDGKFSLGRAKLTADAKGDFVSGNFENFKAVATVADNTKIDVTGKIDGFGRDSVIADITASIPLAYWAKAPIAPPVPFHFDSGSLTADVKLDGRMGKGFNTPEFKINTNVKLSDLTGGVKDLNASFSKITADIKASARLNRDKTISNVNANITADGAGFKIKNQVKSAPFKINLQAMAPNKRKTRFNGAIRFTSNKVTAGSKQTEAQFPLDASSNISVDLSSGDYKVTDIDIKAGALASLAGKGEFNDTSQKFDIALDIKKLDSALVFNLLPVDVKRQSGIDMVAGIFTGKITGAGKAPEETPTDTRSLPFKADIDIKVKDGKLLSSKYEAAVEGIEVDVQAGVAKNRAYAAGGFWLEKAILQKITGDIIIDPRLEFDLEFIDESKLLINRLAFETPELGVVESLEGSVAGIDLDRFAKAADGDLSAIHDLDIALENFVSITLEKSRKFFTDMTMFGEVDTLVTVDADPGESVVVAGESEFKNLLITKAGQFLVSKLSGQFPFSKNLEYLKENDSSSITDAISLPSSSTKDLRETSFFEDIRGQSADRDNITIEAVNVGPIDMRKTVFDLFFKDTSFGLDYLRSSLLGGGLAGAVQIKGEKSNYTFRTNGVFAGIDFARLITKDLGLKGKESEIDGDMTMELSLTPDESRDEIDISKIDLAAHLSRIEAKALDRFLLFLDPNESTPSIMSARTVLKFAKPTRVNLIARYGALSLTINLKYSPLLGGQTVVMPVIKKFPINSLVNFEAIRVHLKKLNAVSDLMRTVASTHLVFGNDGKLELK